MADQNAKVVPGIPLAALDNIEDQNVRDVLRAMVDGWHVRNGAVGNGGERFVTAGELGLAKGVRAINGVYGGGPAATGQGGGLKPGDVARIINDLQAQVLESPLFQELGERVTLIDLSVVAEREARINAIADEAATRLGFDQVHGSAINALQTTTDTQATQISGLTTRIGTAESTIVTLQTTTADQSQSLHALDTRASNAESRVSTLETTTANQANSISLLTTRVSGTESAILNEQTTRANADNAITTSVNTQFTQVNNNVSALQTQQTTTANNVASLSQQVTTLQSTTGANTTAIQNEITARTNADGAINSRYSVKIDTNGYVTGFGLISTANNSTPFSEFIVRADRFAIGSPSGPGIEPKIPFIVTTTYSTLSNGTVVPPGVYIDEAVLGHAVITRANIGLAEVDSLRIAGNSVTVGTYDSAGYAVVPASNGWTQYVSLMYRTVDLGDGYNTGVMVMAVVGAQAYADASFGVRILINGYEVGRSGQSLFGGYTDNIAVTGFSSSPGRYCTVELQVFNNPSGPGSNVGSFVTNSSMAIMGGKR